MSEIRDVKINNTTYTIGGMNPPVLLWENESPTVNIPSGSITVPVTITIDSPTVSDFRYYVGEFNFATSGYSKEYAFGKIGDSIYVVSSTQETTASSHIYSRNISLTPEGTLTIYSGSRVTTNSTTVDNSNLIPNKIWGIY